MAHADPRPELGLELEDAGVVVPHDDGPLTILHPTTLTLRERRIGLIGANGSGKSTLVRVFNGLRTLSTGTARVSGVDVARHTASVRKMVGFVFTDPDAQLVMPTPLEDVALSLRRTPGPRPLDERALDVLSTYGLADRAHTSVHALSGGQKQLLAIAGVLAIEPSVLICDEPTTLLDLPNSEMIGDLLMSVDAQLVVATHDLDLAARMDRVLVMSAGAVTFDGDPAAAIAHYRDSVRHPHGIGR